MSLNQDCTVLIKYVTANKFFEDIIIPRIDNTRIEEINCEYAAH